MAFPGVKVLPARATFEDDVEVPESPSTSDRSGNQALLATVPTSGVAPAPDGYALRLVVQHTLFDHGQAVNGSPSLRQLIAPAVARVNPYDLDRLGRTAGDVVRLKSAQGQLDIATETDSSVARGTVVVAFNLATSIDPEVKNASSVLLDPAALVTEVRMESR